MVKKGKTKNTKTGTKAKKGAKYVCNVCGIAVTVDKECGCDSCGIACCGQDMEPLTRC